ncbi:MAG TPA: HAMP domain-containing sensor histidine kinase [Anaerolineaceae bacterium]|nr:HAMP domain-containing sensor histidine kinase [Anaerolineaceae bacterium]
MSLHDLLKTLRPIWLQRAETSLATSTLPGLDLQPELERFYDLFAQAVETGESTCLDPLIQEWSESQTQSDLESSSSSLSDYLNELMQITAEVLQSISSSDSYFEMVQSFLPAFGHAFACAAEVESKAKVNFATEQLSRNIQALGKLDHSKSDFIAVIAHELRTPLTLIDGYASMLRENLEQAGVTSYQATLLDGIQRGAQRLQSIINDTIDVSLIDNEILNLNFQPIWLNQLLAILEKEIRPSLIERKQKFEIQPFEGLNLMTYGDPDRLLQVFRNVLINAIKFTPDGGSITVTGRKLPGFIEITISDTGIGIDPEYLLLIFEKFVRLGSIDQHSSGKTKYKGGGPGLGLHIARGIIERHGGSIWVESAGFDDLSYPGSMFHILIPLRAEPPDAKLAKLFAPLIKTSQEKEK